jgi:amidase
VKDVFDTADFPTQYGSPIYAGHRPRWDAAAVASARAAGAVVLGKTVTTEFATMFPGPTVNPHHAAHTPGGSSSGSAAAVAAGMVPFAYATQTVGSTIRPAAYCGVVGYKPSFGTIARAGLKLTSESLDTVGTIARTVADAALLASASAARPGLLEGKPADRPKLRLCRSPNWKAMTPDAARAFGATAARLAAAGARIEERELPKEFDALDEHRHRILCWEIARCMAHEVAHHYDALSAILRSVIDAGRAMPYADYERALLHAEACRRSFAAEMEGFDAIVTPSATGEAPRGLDSTGDTSMNRLWTVLHGPCVTVPAGAGPSGLPLGVQFVGRGGTDSHVLGVARWAEGALK